VKQFGPHPEEAALFAPPSRRTATCAAVPAAILRPSRTSGRAAKMRRSQHEGCNFFTRSFAGDDT